MGPRASAVIIHEPPVEGLGIAVSALLLAEIRQVTPGCQAQFMGGPQQATGLLRRIDQQGLGLVQTTQVNEAMSQAAHGLEPPLAGFVGLLPVDLIGGPVVRLALGIISQVVIGLTDGEADGRLDLGLASEGRADLGRGAVEDL